MPWVFPVQGNAHERHLTLNAGQKVVKVVGYTAGQCSNGLHFLSVLQLGVKLLAFFFCVFASADIPDNSQQMLFTFVVKLSYPYLFERRPGELWISVDNAFKSGWEDPVPLRIKVKEGEMLTAIAEAAAPARFTPQHVDVYDSGTDGYHCYRIPAIETAHALAGAMRLGRELGTGANILINLSGRGDKDVATAAEYFGMTDEGAR